MNRARLFAVSLVAVAHTSACVWCLGFDPPFLDAQYAKLDKAIAEDDVDTLVKTCTDPDIGGACNGYVRIPVPGVPDRACDEMKVRAVARQDKQISAAIEKDDHWTLRRLCDNSEIYKKVTNSDLGLDAGAARACAAFDVVGEKKFSRLSAEAIELDGVSCLNLLAKNWRQFESDHLFVTPTKTTDAQRAAFNTPAETCLASLEARSQSKTAISLYTEMQKEPVLAGPWLEPALATRLATLQGELPARVVASIAAMASSDRPPAARAALLASAASVAKKNGDTHTADKHLAAARAALAKDGTPENLTVSVVGEGDADDVASSVIRTLGKGLVKAERGEIALQITLSEASFDADQSEFELTATVREQRGTKSNPAYQKKSEQCDRYERTVTKEVDYCAENPKLVNCDWHRRDLAKCRKEIASIPQTVPAYADVQVPYAAIKYRGSASGSLTITRDGKTTTHRVSASDSRVAHGSVPKANISSESASPYSRGELARIYSSAAHGVVSSYVDQIAEKRAQAFLVDSKRDDDVLVGAVRFAMVTGQLPPKSVTKDVDSRYGVPVTPGIDLIAKGLR